MPGEADLAMRAMGDAEFDVARVLQEQFRAVSADFLAQHADPAQALSIIGSAAAMFAGIQFGQLIAAGAMRNQDQRRIIEMTTHNAREGIKVGQRRFARITSEGAPN